MIRLIKESYPIARKNYDCMAYEWLNDTYCFDEFSIMTFSERKSIVKARNNKGKILKGSKYLYQFLVDGDDSWSFRAIPELHQICLKYEIYPK